MRSYPHALERHRTAFAALASVLTLLAALAVAAAPAAADHRGKAGTSQAGGTQAPGEEPAHTEPPPPQGGPTTGGGASPDAQPDPVNAVLGKARLARNRRIAIAPVDAPEQVRAAIRWANRITSKPYRYGGGHRRFNDSGYDCSGAISYALRGGGLLRGPLDSRAFRRWGEAGPGQWITVYTNPGHAYVVIAGLRFDTSGSGGRGPRWRIEPRSPRGYHARHFEGL